MADTLALPLFFIFYDTCMLIWGVNKISNQLVILPVRSVNDF